METFNSYHSPQIITELRYTNSGKYSKNGNFITDSMFDDIEKIAVFTELEYL